MTPWKELGKFEEMSVVECGLAEWDLNSRDLGFQVSVSLHTHTHSHTHTHVHGNNPIFDVLGILRFG
jgi:hypothetical protein